MWQFSRDSTLHAGLGRLEDLKISFHFNPCSTFQPMFSGKLLQCVCLDLHELRRKLEQVQINLCWELRAQKEARSGSYDCHKSLSGSWSTLPCSIPAFPWPCYIPSLSTPFSCPVRPPHCSEWNSSSMAHAAASMMWSFATMPQITMPLQSDWLHFH